MAERCNGAEVRSTAEIQCGSAAVFSPKPWSESRTKTLENLPSTPAVSEFIPCPHVRLERIDITPYLNRPTQRRSAVGRPKKGGKIDELHARRLLQVCVVKLHNEDLEELRRLVSRPAATSGSEDEGPADMIVKCKICDKVYHSEKKLLKHSQNKHIIYTTPKKTPKRVSFSEHVIVHEVKEYHKCRKCSKIFEEYKSLKQHMRKWHKKRKCYICNYCDKKFVDRMIFKVHIKLHCDMCGALFSNRSNYLEHRREKCRVYKVHKCKMCQESYFSFMALKEHSYSHNEELHYVCDICKDQFKTKCAIAHHIMFLHSDRRRPKELYEMLKMGSERIYLCAFCDETSVERYVLEAHVTSLPDLANKATTGYKDYYFCDQCMQQFETESAMLQHKWTHYLINPNSQHSKPKGDSEQPKRFYNINEQIPQNFKPVVILDRIDKLKPSQFVEISQTTLENPVNKPIVDPKSKKTLLSRHQCETCGKYYSSNSCLNRHIASQHSDFENLRCNVCEETFVWPSLLRSHKCIRLNLPERPFEDARPEIMFENSPMLYQTLTQSCFDDLNIDNDYMNEVDFDIPAPAVELRECDSTFTPTILPDAAPADFILPDKNGVSAGGYKLVMQEVPIEF